MTTNVKERFLKDVAHHGISVIHDEGVYRHVRFRQPGDSNQWFELVTWPGHLSIGGDMGTYVFSRTVDPALRPKPVLLPQVTGRQPLRLDLEDMFKFFRRDQLAINEGYWAEKVVASDRIPVKEFRVESVRQWFRENLRDTLRGWNKDPRLEIVQQVRELFEGIDEMSEEEIRNEINGINVDGDCVFYDMWEVDFTQYTHHFLWCLHAIVWGIGKYDAAKNAKGAVS